VRARTIDAPGDLDGQAPGSQDAGAKSAPVEVTMAPILPRLRRSLPAAVAAALLVATATASAATAPIRIGFPAGDDWEPAMAIDAGGTIFAAWTHYGPDPACPACASPHTELQVSTDGGSTWSEPRALAPSAERQDDPQLVVDPVDGTTLYAAWMQADKASEYVARSDDHGATWNPVLVEPLQRGTDKDILVARGNDVYLAYHTQQKIYVSASHDRGETWTLSQPIHNTAHLGVSLGSGGAIDGKGTVYFAWNGVKQHGRARGPITLYVTASDDGGATWRTSLVDVSAAPPDCGCSGWDYWGAQMALAVDAANTVYVAWNASRTDFGPNGLYFARSTDAGHTWSAPKPVSDAPPGTNNAFPAIVAGAAGDVRVAWMDDRAGHDAGGYDPAARWNTFLRTTTDGGATWSDSTQLSAYVPGYDYKLAAPNAGFLQPYGDYFEIDIDPSGRTHAIWGEGISWDGPGNVWYASAP
jgi:hypothetical protein